MYFYMHLLIITNRKLDEIDEKSRFQTYFITFVSKKVSFRNQYRTQGIDIEHFERYPALFVATNSVYRSTS